MPVRSLNSSVLRWPDPRQVDKAVRAWAARAALEHPEVLAVGYFGSYARGNWGVGSDVDLVLIVDRTEVPWERRAAAWDAADLPVPAEVFVYDAEEWRGLIQRPGFQRNIAGEAVWVYQRPGVNPALPPK